MSTMLDTTCEPANVADGGVVAPWRERARVFINIAIVALLTQFDFYRSGFRIGEVVAYGLVFVLGMLFLPKSDHLGKMAILFAAGLIYLLFGLNNGLNYETVKSAFGIFIALCTIIAFSIYEVRVSGRVIRILIWINIGFFLVQMIVFYAAGELIDYHWFTDVEERLESTIFRPAGLYYEPATYCLAMFMLSALLDPRDSKFNVTELAVAATMVLSLSLWGFVGALVLVGRIAPFKPRIAVAAVFVVAVAVYAFANAQNLDALDVSEFVFDRLSNLEFDNSAVDRYSNLFRLFQEADTTLIFGTGFGGNQDVYGGSTLGRLLTETGVLGFVGLMMMLVRQSVRPIDFIVCLVPVLLAAALVTYGFFGLWLSLMSFQSYARRGSSTMETSTPTTIDPQTGEAESARS